MKTIKQSETSAPSKIKQNIPFWAAPVPAATFFSRSSACSHISC